MTESSDRGFPPEDEVLALVQRCSNAGRWGPDDERGTLNFITDEKRTQAAQLVKTGRSLSIGKDLDRTASKKNPWPIFYRMLFAGDGLRWHGMEEQQSVPIGALDSVEVAPHGIAVTHLDALGHTNFEGHIYNGRDAREVVTSRGLTFASIYGYRDGILTRGVLLDVARARGTDWLSGSDSVWRKDLDAAERLAGVTVGRGDAIFVRTGLGAREAAEGTEDPGMRAGLMPDCLPWLYEREIAVYSGDCFDRMPSPYKRLPLYFHMICLPVMGLALLDNPDLEELARVAHELNRYEFMFTCAPARLPGGTGWPVNPICVF